MKLCRPVTEGTIPRAADVVAIRCAEHGNVPPTNSNDNDGSECGICVGVTLAERLAASAMDEAQRDILDGYANRLTYCAMLRSKLASARDRLNLLQPGAGDFLTEDDQP